MFGLRNTSFGSHPKTGLRWAASLAAILVAIALFFAIESTRVIGRPLNSYKLGAVAGVISLIWVSWALITQWRADGRWRVALIFILAATLCMLGSLLGMVALGYNITNSQLDMMIQIAGILTYVSCGSALFALPAKRMLAKRKLPWIMDVAVIVTAISAAGWFFLIAPQVRFEGFRFAFWLTFAYPLANLVSVASIVAAISLGGPFRSARGLLMVGIILNVAGDVIQAIYVQRQVQSPAGYTHLIWIASTLAVALAALQVRFDRETPTRIEPVEDETQRLSPAHAVIPVLFLMGLVILALWGNSARPNSNDVIGLNFCCMVAIVLCLGRILGLINDNADLAKSLGEANANLDTQVQERTVQLSEAMDDLAQQKAFLRSVIDALPAFVVSQNADGKVLLANNSAATLFGKTRKEFEGSMYSEVVSLTNPRAAAVIEGESRSLLTGGCAITVERTVTGVDGQERTYEVVKTPVQGRSGVPEQVLIVGNDITVRKEAEKALIDARDAAEQSTRVKSEFLAKMSHEIRTPMNGVLGLAELLLTENLSPRHRELAQSLKTSGENLLAIVNDILDFAQLDSGRATLEPIPCSLTFLLGEVVESYRPQAEAKDIRLRCDVHLDPDARFLADPERLRQIVRHLLSNAIKFTESGTVNLEVDVVRQSQDLATVRISVQDSGVGIPSEHLASVFEPFSQVDNSMSRAFGGAGLGLSLCRQAISLMGGTIAVESREGEGSVFVVDLPLKRAIEADRPSGPRLDSFAGLKTLVVEDNSVNQLIMQQLLRRFGCSVVLANNGQEAVDWLQANQCDLVLMDCQMPVMDGLDATRRIRQFDSPMRTVPIVAVTANAMTGDRERCLAAGMDDYVAKPIRIDALTSALSRLFVTRHAA